MKVYHCFILLFVIFPILLSAQVAENKPEYTLADSLQGKLSPHRTCYDVKFYHLDVRLDIDKRYISGSNLFKFKATENLKELQFDLFANLNIDKIVYKNKKLNYTRQANAVFVAFPDTIRKGQLDEFSVFYSGHPTVTDKAPRKGGVVFSTDSIGNPFVSTACEGTGASVWWPNKDHLSDEADSMLISVSVPKNLKDVSNGRLRKIIDLKDGYTKYDWFVANPINNYNVAVNIGDFTHIQDSYEGEKGNLDLDYWVLSYNEDSAKKQFSKNVKPMLAAYESWCGPYPFYEDGYKLVETPYPAMEHQSAISYGGFLKGFPPNEMQAFEGGEKWDFIIVHESAHEWFGNNITANDLGDVWIHEAFGTYMESLFIEELYGKERGQQYLYKNREHIANDKPIAGPYEVNKMGSGDMYAKGAALINMLRVILDNDEQWRSILRGMNQFFYHKTVDYNGVISYLDKQCKKKLKPIFDQYLFYPSIPVLEFAKINGTMYYRWISAVEGFDMPIRIKIDSGKYQWIYPTTAFKPLEQNSVSKANIEVDTNNFYVGVLFN